MLIYILHKPRRQATLTVRGPRSIFFLGGVEEEAPKGGGEVEYLDAKHVLFLCGLNLAGLLPPFDAAKCRFFYQN